MVNNSFQNNLKISKIRKQLFKTGIKDKLAWPKDKLAWPKGTLLNIMLFSTA